MMRKYESALYDPADHAWKSFAVPKRFWTKSRAVKWSKSVAILGPTSKFTRIAAVDHSTNTLVWSEPDNFSAEREWTKLNG